MLTSYNFYLFSSVVGAPDNVNNNLNYIYEGYHLADLNLDGNTIYSGPNNDRSIAFLQVGLNYTALNYIIAEQIPGS